jgi:hypothetical protein
MTEQNQQNKKPGLCRRIFRWIGLGLLTLLLIAGFIFQAPWKVLTLLAVILAACTILPKPARKWFWLSVSVVLIALIIWVLLPEDDQGWRPYTFEKEIAVHETKYAIPDEENAAVIYNELLKDYDLKKMEPKFLRPGEWKVVLSQPWVSRDYPELALWLHGHENTIKILTKACSIKMCRFPSNFKLAVTDKLQINRNIALKSWAVLLLLSANNDIAEGRLDQGLLKYTCALRIAYHLHQQKRIIDFLISFGIEGLALPPLNSLVIQEQLTEEQLRIVSDNLKNLENNWSSDFSRCLEYDKFFVKNTFSSLVYETDAKGRVRFSRNPVAAIWERFRLRKLKETYWQRKSMKAYTILTWFTLPVTPQKAAEIIEKIYEEHHAMAEPTYAWGKEKTAPPPSLELNCRFLIWALTNRTSRLYGGFHDIYLKRLAQRRGSMLLIALKQYNNENGTWPASLNVIKSRVPAEALIDPAGGNEFEYENHGERFSLFGETVNIWPK